MNNNDPQRLHTIIKKFKEELEIIAQDCEDTAKESIALQGGGPVSTAEQRAWLAVAFRIRYISQHIK